MTSDLCTDDVVVCITSPQVISTEGVAVGGRVAASSAAVELGRRLLLAARGGDTGAVLDLMAKGAPFTTDWLGTSPLHLAATNNHVDTCAVLLRAGVSRDSRTKVERTPLHMAAYAGHADVVQLLLQHDAAVDCRDMLRMTPLHWAAQRGHAAAVAALLAAGCELAPRSKFGHTPRQLAAAAARPAVLALLDQAAAQRLRPPERRRAPTVSISSAEAAPTAPTTPTWRAQRLSVNVKETNVEATEDTEVTTQGYHPIHRLQEIKTTNIKIKPQQDKTSTNEQKTETNNNSNSSDTSAAQLLRRHGITLLPTDDGSTVLSALQSGRTVVLSDAGKLMLKESSPPTPVPAPTTATTPTPSPAATLAPTAAAEVAAPAKGLKLFTLNNKLLLQNKPLAKANLTNVQLSQVKFVQLKDKLLSPKKTVPLKVATKRPRQATPVKIIVNKNNYKLLSGPGLPTSNAQPSMAEVTPTTPESSVMDTSPGDDRESLRAQLQAARKAIAALTAELASCKARLAVLEQRRA